MRRLWIALVAVMVLAIVLPTVAMAHTEADPYVTDLVWGRKLVDIGSVKVWNDATNLYVRFETDAGWYLFDSHVDVKTEWQQIPQKSGNAIPGKFAYSHTLDFEDGYTQVIPMTWAAGQTVYISAHAVAGSKGGSVADVCADLPASVTELVTGPGSLSYLNIDLSGGTSLDGSYNGWCINPLVNITSGMTGPASVYCSYGTVPDGMVDYPENLDKVNWVLNQDFAAQGYSWTAVQSAIWALLSSQPDVGISTLSPNMAHVTEIVNAANTYGEGFTPGCDQYVAILLLPTDPYTGLWRQPNMIVKKIPCYETNAGTAWGNGVGFPGADWSMYFGYGIQ